MRCYKGSILHDDPRVLPHIDQMWRILIGLGCVPAVVALYFRLTIPETPRFTMDVERNVKQATQDVENFLTTGSYYVDPDAVIERVQAPKATRRDFIAYFSKFENAKLLFGTSYSWFALDIAFYGINLNQNVVLQQIGFDGSSGTPWNRLFKISIGNIIITVLGFVPGYYATVLTVEKLGRKWIQTQGFLMAALFLGVLAGMFERLGTVSFVVCFAFLQVCVYVFFFSLLLFPFSSSLTSPN